LLAWARRGLVVTALLALLFFAYITAIRLAFALFYVGLMLFAVAWLWTRLGARGLELRRDGPDGAYEAGEKFVEHLEVGNNSILGLPWVEVSDRAGIPGYNAGRVLSLGAKQTRRWRSDGIFDARGTYVMGPLTISTGDAFGLFRATRLIPGAGRVVVYPPIIDAGVIVSRLSGAAGDTVAVGRHVDTPPEAFGIREYTPDDGVNRIHWPSTARLGRPMSRSFEKYEGTDMLIALDLGRAHHFGGGESSSLERAVSLAASIAMLGAGRGQAVGLVCSDASATAIRPGRGAGHIARMLTALAIARADGEDAFERTIEAAMTTRGPHTLFVITPGTTDWTIDRMAAAPSGNLRSTIVHLTPGSFAHSSRRPRRVTETAIWWDISVSDEIFAARPASGASDATAVASATETTAVEVGR
jgi:uncharacterized protein (DUF58 family)